VQFTHAGYDCLRNGNLYRLGQYAYEG
jgi:hypothetical protein